MLDIDLTANRGDCTNIIGLAREAAAVLGTEFRMPDMSVQETAGGNAAEMAKVDGAGGRSVQSFGCADIEKY